MIAFQRALRWFFRVSGFLVGIVLTLAAVVARRLVSPPRQPLWAAPSDLGLDFEETAFPAADGVRLSGWFIPAGAGATGATVILLHGWAGNRLGNAAEDVIDRFSHASPTSLLRLAHALHRDDYHVLMFDLRNHGRSAAAPPTTAGLREAQDLLGALAYLRSRSDVDDNSLGVVGFALGANALLYALPQTDAIQAGIAVQPASAGLFARRFAGDMLGPLALPVVLLVEQIYELFGGPPFSALQPAFAASGAGNTPILFVQGSGDRWGSVTDVAQMASALPNAEGPLLLDTLHRSEGSQYLVDNPEIVSTFLGRHLL